MAEDQSHVVRDTVWFSMPILSNARIRLQPLVYEINPTSRSICIGHTWFGRQWWGSGHNAASKLLLLTYAFETLGAVRVAWHTDIKNERSQAAIEKLGAQREGVWRKHRLRRDGTWRDTVQYAMTDDEWPAAAARLRIRSGC